MNVCRKAILLCGLVWVSSALRAQEKFDVVSIRPIKNSEMDHPMVIMNPSNTGRFRASGITIRMLMHLAFGIPENRILGGPSWLDDNLYEIDARSDPDAGKSGSDLDTRKRRQAMLTNLLKDRLALQFHFGQKHAQSYVLTQAPHQKSFLRLSATTDSASAHFSVVIDGERTTFHDATMQAILDVLGQNLDTPILDKTNLNGRYDGTLRWTPGVARKEADTGDAAYILAEALDRDWGLHLAKSKADVPTIMIDHVDLPTPN